jgi:hypothetical protein
MVFKEKRSKDPLLWAKSGTLASILTLLPIPEDFQNPTLKSPENQGNETAL